MTDSGASDSGGRDAGESGASIRVGELVLSGCGGETEISAEAEDIMPLPDGVGVGV